MGTQLEHSTNNKSGIKQLFRDDNAVSEIIGEVLLTAIAVLAFSVIAVFIFSYLESDDIVHADIDGWVDVNSDTVYIRHTGGESIDLNKVEVVLNLNGTRRDLSSSQLEQIIGSNSWNLGQTIVIDADVLWNTTINEDDYVGMILLQKDSNFVIESGSLLGEETGIDSGTSGNGNTSQQQSPSAAFTYSPPSPGTYEPVVLTDLSSDPDGTVVGWSWNFGDGGTSTDQNPTHQYSAEGIFTLSLTVTDNDGNTDSTSQSVTVVAPAGTFADQITLNTPSKGGVIKDGGYISFTNDGNYRYIDIEGTRYNLNQNDDIKLEVVNDQTTGSISMNIGNSQISTFDLNANLYINDVLQDTGQVTDLYVQPISNYYSTLRYELPSDLSQTYLEADGDVIINWQTNDSAINISNIGFYGSGSTQVNFDSSSTYITCSGYYQLSSPEQNEEPEVSSVLPVSRWKFDEGSGSIAYDSIGDNDANIYDVQWSQGQSINGSAMYFDGNGDYLVISDDGSLDFDQNMSLVFWLRLRTNNDVCIIGKGINDQDNFDLFVSGGELWFEWTSSGYHYVQTSGMNLAQNNWYQIGVVVDGSDVNFYKDATFVESLSMNGFSLAPNNNDMWVGRQNYGSNNYYLRAYLDELEIYNVTLDESDMADYYARTNP
ncbi:type IV pilin [Methanolobus bombayensis]|uniref:type IV pilin n=1 Tax=Methanolobus bombayensis TaxID=38023 RepID=UPI001AEB18AD|nr:type IV pilin [Methanolobus bombayensis]MBP1908618.1 PKD repeat protein [Methanolobus bombayensis]